LSKKLNRDQKLGYVLMGDGELQEGQIWEAAMFAPHNKVDNLIAVVDYNGQQIDGATENVLSLGDLRSKWEAFGWEVLEMNGNDMADTLEGLAKAKEMTGNGKPIVILMKTEMSNGVDFMMGSHKWHGIAPNDEQLASALAQLEETLGDYESQCANALCNEEDPQLEIMKKYAYTEKKDTRCGFGAGLLVVGRNNANVVALCADLICSFKMNDFIKE